MYFYIKKTDIKVKKIYIKNFKKYINKLYVITWLRNPSYIITTHKSNQAIPYTNS